MTKHRYSEEQLQGQLAALVQRGNKRLQASWQKAQGRFIFRRLEHWVIMWGTLIDGVCGVTTLGLWSPGLGLRLSFWSTTRETQRLQGRKTYFVAMNGFDFKGIYVRALSSARARYLCAKAYAGAELGSILQGLKLITSCRIVAHADEWPVTSTPGADQGMVADLGSSPDSAGMRAGKMMGGV